MAEAKNVVFDARWMTPVPSGITVYSRELMRRIPALEPSWRWNFLFRNEEQRESVLASLELPTSLRATAHILPYGPLSPRSQCSLPRFLRSIGSDLFHSPNYMVPYLAFGGPKTLLGLAPPALKGCGRCIANIHDAIPLILRDYAPRSTTSRMLWLYRASLRFTIRSSVFTITGSDASRQDITKALSLSEKNASSFRTIYDGVSERFSPLRAEARRSNTEPGRDKATKVVLYVGRLDPYKNVPALVDAFAMLLREENKPLHLLIIGPEDKRYPEARLHAQYRGIQEHVTFIHGASDAELLAAYRNASVLVNPSRYEGFGLPMVEAMKCGIPVICADGGSQPEIAGGAAEVVPVGDEQALVAAMKRVLFDDAHAADLSARGLARAANFSWDTAAAETLALYREALSK